MPSSKRIIIAVHGSLGDLFPYMTLAKGLQARGHDVVVATNSEHRKRINEAGLKWNLMRPELPEDPSLYAKATDPQTGLEFIFRHIFAPTVQDSYEDLASISENADLLISSPLAIAVPPLVEKQNLLWVSGLLQPMAFFSSYDPPVLSEAYRLTKTLHPLGRLWGTPLRALARAATKSWCQPVYDLRRALGLSTGLDPFWEGQDSPHLILAMFPSVLAAPQPDWPAHARVTGALFWDGSEAEQQVAPELATFLDNGSPPIVFTLGSVIANEAKKFYVESLKAVQALNCRAIFLYGSSAESRAQLPETLPPGVLAIPYAPHARIFPKASVIVHHGGIGTLSQAMRAGKPMLILPHNADQPDNAARAGRLGIARTLTPAAYNAASVASELRVLLNSETIRSRAEAVGKQVQVECGVATACNLLESLMETKRRVPIS